MGVEEINITGMKESELKKFLKDNGLFIKLDEARKIPKLIGRNPTITELHIFNTQWSEHTSYKSSREILKQLPTSGPTVILGPKEDSGIAFFTKHNGERYGLVISHESHNHPSQVVPFEGAATGIGGNVRDVLCMGAKVIASADPLRFGNPDGKNASKVKYIANGVIDGIAGYGNPLGVPVIAGDIYFNSSFDENCLCNVVTVGLVKEKEIIHSFAPKGAVGYDIIVVGKATDNSGFGGAAFASVILNEEDSSSNRGAVQVPDPFLKNVLIRATTKVFEEVRKKNIPVGFKDMGAGGIMGSTTEIVDGAGYGAEIEVDKIHVSIHDLPPFITICSETQERFTWICPPNFTDTILKIYNEDYDLPNVSEGARASVVGKVTKSTDYVLKHKGRLICKVNVGSITKGIKYNRKSKKSKKNFKEPKIKDVDLNKKILEVLNNPNVASKEACYKHYDSMVQGITVLGPGVADAGVQKPIHDSPAAYALSVDSNPKYSRIDPYWGGALAVAESMRNVASVGGVPIALTDCLNYGNPEKESAFYNFKEGVKGISDAAKSITVKNAKGPVPFISGNVSFYNESSKGASVDPSPIIGCLGVLKDVSKCISMKIKKQGTNLIMIGERRDELGGSVFYDTLNETGKNIPQIDFNVERDMIHAIIDLIDNRLLLSCHDISDGGMISCLSEMILGGEAVGTIGCNIDISWSTLPSWKTLFTESTGFIIEVENDNLKNLEKILTKYNLTMFSLGKTTGNKLSVRNNDNMIVDLKINEIRKAWTTGLTTALK